MPSARSLPPGRVAALAGCLALAGLFACTDQQPTSSAPGAAPARSVSGDWTSAAWTLGAAGPELTSGVTGHAATVDGGRRVATVDGSLRPFTPSAAQRQALQGSLLRAPAVPEKRAGRAGTPVLRPSLRGARVETSRTLDGREIRTQTVGGERGAPPVATLTTVDGRARSLVQYGHDGRRLTQARSTLFGADGRPARVIVNDYRLTETDARRVSAAKPALGGIGSLAGGAAGTLANLLGPATLCAQWDACLSEQNSWAMAREATWAAEWALNQAYAACQASIGAIPPIWPDPCDAVAPAQQAYSDAQMNEWYAWLTLQDCQTYGPPPPSGGGGGGGGGQNCYWIIWEISYDGGNTWEYLDSEYVCQNAM